MEQLAAWSAAGERLVAEIFHPGFPFDRRVTGGWPVTRLDHALLILAAYFVLVAIGIVRSQRARGITPVRKRLTLADSFAQEPIKFLVVAYNAVQVLLSLWMAVAMAVLFVEKRMGFTCNDFDVSSPDVARVLWVFYLSKILDMADTLFIVLREKWDQLSFLHVYHHSTIFILYWSVTLIGYDGDAYFPVLANSTVHCVMYFYYLLTCFDIRPAWGKYLTQLQMLQFGGMLAQAAPLVVLDYCAFPRRFAALYLAYAMSLLALFRAFYLQRWSARRPKPRRTD